MKHMAFISLILMTASASAEGFGPTLTQVTGLTPGNYRLRDGDKADENCNAGVLTFRDKTTKFGPGVIIRLNRDNIGGAIGVDDEGGERGSTWKSHSVYKPGYIKYELVERLPKRAPVFIKYEFTSITPNGFTYSSSDEKTGPYECVLVREN